MLSALTLVFHLASRLAYVVGIGVALTKQERHQYFTRRYGMEGGFHQFRRIASFLMTIDAVSFVILCLVTRHTVSPALPAWLLVGAGGVLVAIGIAMKVWATVRLGSGAFYWQNFFEPGQQVRLDPPGPYRYLKNPMYTVGYSHMYGFALAFGSLPGLIAAAFAQAGILVFYQLVEKPHFELLSTDTSTARRA